MYQQFSNQQTQTQYGGFSPAMTDAPSTSVIAARMNEIQKQLGELDAVVDSLANKIQPIRVPMPLGTVQGQANTPAPPESALSLQLGVISSCLDALRVRLSAMRDEVQL